MQTVMDNAIDRANTSLMSTLFGEKKPIVPLPTTNDNYVSTDDVLKMAQPPSISSMLFQPKK